VFELWYGSPVRIVLVAVLLAACSSPSRGPTGLPDAHEVIVDVPPAVCFEPSISGTAAIGNANVQDCAIWNNVARMTGSVTLTRTTSSFSIDFANGLSFTGAITGSQVELTHVEPHTFSDGCLWQSTETLAGTIDPATCVLTLAYDYAETVTQSNGACATPCSGHADVSLQITPVQ
jgi:hypothetical protein